MTRNVKVLAAVNWPLCTTAREGEVHPGDIKTTGERYWYFDRWPSSFIVEANGINETLLERLWNKALPIPLLSAMRIALQGKKNDLVVANGTSLGIPLGFLMKKLLRKKMVVIDNALSRYVGPEKWFHNKLASLGISNIDLMVCHSSRQVEIYKKYISCRSIRYAFVPYGASKWETTTVNEPHMGSYIFAGGNAFRDYGVLCDAVSGTGIETRIASSKWTPRRASLPEEVQLLGRLSFPEYKEQIAGARIIVVPLIDCAVSAGQLAITQAMLMGKTIIATDTIGTVDYVVPGEDGFLVPPGEPGPLRSTILSIWSDFQKISDIGERAKETAISKFSEELMAERILEEIIPLLKDNVPQSENNEGGGLSDGNQAA